MDTSNRSNNNNNNSNYDNSYRSSASSSSYHQQRNNKRCGINFIKCKKFVYMIFFIFGLIAILSSQRSLKLLDPLHELNFNTVSLDPFHLSSDQNNNNNIIDAEFDRTLEYNSELVEDGIDIGVLSTKDSSFFHNIQEQIDEEDHVQRCLRYNAYYNKTHPKNRRIFYGALIANEPWELFEIVAAEVYGIYTGMVFVEGNRTQNFTPRPFKRLHHNIKLADLFGIENNEMVQIRQFVNEDNKVRDLDREHKQRAEILVGWKELGMLPNDVALLADSDETFTRDFLRAIQVCDGIDILDYNIHHCQHSKVKLSGRTRVFETSPECITKDRSWYHPDMIIGHCVEGISTNPIHKPAPRSPGSFLRADGFGKDCQKWDEEAKITDNSYPLWNGADFRRTCGGRMYHLNTFKQPFRQFDPFTAYHFHNFISHFNKTRFKYLTYGHWDRNATIKPIEEMSNDLKMMYRCIKDMKDDDDQRWKRIEGGYKKLNPWLPIYFQDDNYRQRRHEHVKKIVQDDENYITKLRKKLGIIPNDDDDKNDNQKEKDDADDKTIKIVDNNVNDNNVVTTQDNNIASVEVEIPVSVTVDGIDTGVLSTKDASFFRNIQSSIDEEDNVKRCERYDAYYNKVNPKNRRIFYGALIANEPWELFEIVAAEVYGLYSGMVFVEGNRTQNFTPRPFKRLSDGPKIANLFGLQVDQVQVRAFVNEDSKVRDLDREHKQRAEILIGWKELGMQPDDVALLADSDETFTRDFVRAVQVCDGIDLLDYNSHHCQHSKVKLVGRTRVFETSSECITKDRSWFHPDMIIGHCVEGISTNPLHQPALRSPGSFLRAEGFGKDCGDWQEEDKIKNNSYPLWNGADFRRTCGGRMYQLSTDKDLSRRFSPYTAYHFHNFIATFNNTRFKYLTYGHWDRNATIKPIEEMSNDLKMMYRCVKDMKDDDEQVWKRIEGGFNKIDPWLPIYFQDDDYRKRRHAFVKEMVRVDDEYIKFLRESLGIKDPDRQVNLRSLSYSDDPSTVSDPKTVTDVNIQRVRGASIDPHEIQLGVLSTKEPSFFRNLQAEIDREDNEQRCSRYGGTYNAENPKNRRIFYGSLIANEPWELFEIVAAEVHGIYSGIVFVESNRTQNATPRPFKRLSDGPKLAELFGVDEDRVQVRTYVEEDRKIGGLYREHKQRAEILVGWKEMGMEPDDVSLLADSDETFTRDFLRAIQVCDGIQLLEYEKHHCHHSRVKISSRTRVFESSPECITGNRALVPS